MTPPDAHSQKLNIFSRALYNGIIPGLQRQMAFSAIRIGAYETVKQKYVQISGAEGTLTLLGVRIAAGVTTGIMNYKFLTTETNSKALYIFRRFFTRPHQ